ncbi:MAG: arsenate reductase (glutaredoxin) [Gammaproteobacteria bacterium]|nr:arsenate reductase (glutaredoxin) [Gammaproteobacteria bacterium]
MNWKKPLTNITIATMSATLYHNPRCSKSRATLALLQTRGVDLDVVFYLDTPPSCEQLRKLIAMLNMSPRQLMRTGEKEYREQGLDDPKLGDDELIAALHKFPKLMERPILVMNGKARIGRPPESVIEIL